MPRSDINEIIDMSYPRPKKTNADRVRSMSNKELARFLLNVNCAYAEPCMTGEKECKYEHHNIKDCEYCFLEWLQSNVEEK